jgi:DNA-binding CsgD family transcriptional regulator
MNRKQTRYNADEGRADNPVAREVAALRRRIQTLEKSEAERRRVEEALRQSQESAHRLAEENEIIAKIGRVISSSLNIEEVYEQFAREANRLIPFDRIAVNLIHPDPDTITVTYISGMEIDGLHVGDVIPLKSSILEKILHSRRGVLIQPESEQELEKRYPFIKIVFRAGLRSILSVALIFRDQVIGALHLRSKKNKAYTESDLRLAERIADQIAGAVANAQLFLQCKYVEGTLKKRSQELKIKSHNLKEVNTTLKVLLRQREDDIVEVEKRVLTNLQELVWPYLERLKNARLNPLQNNYLNILANNLQNIVSPFLNKLKSRHRNLTSREIQIVNLIQQGKTTKEIAAALNLSSRGVEFHRHNIRAKMGLKNRKANLASFLSSLP